MVTTPSHHPALGVGHCPGVPRRNQRSKAGLVPLPLWGAMMLTPADGGLAVHARARACEAFGTLVPLQTSGASAPAPACSASAADAEDAAQEACMMAYASSAFACPRSAAMGAHRENPLGFFLTSGWSQASQG
jgi:hypothetical protein